MSPLTYSFEHQAELEIALERRLDGSERLALDSLLVALGVALGAYPTLGGAVDHAEALAPDFSENTEEGKALLTGALVRIALHYDAPSALG